VASEASGVGDRRCNRSVVWDGPGGQARLAHETMNPFRRERGYQQWPFGARVVSKADSGRHRDGRGQVITNRPECCPSSDVVAEAKVSERGYQVAQDLQFNT